MSAALPSGEAGSVLPNEASGSFMRLWARGLRQSSLCTSPAIFPLHFAGDPGLTTGNVEGHVEGFYRKSREGVHVSTAVPENGEDAHTTGAQWLQMSARSIRGYPQPEDNFEYRKISYVGSCVRC